MLGLSRTEALECLQESLSLEDVLEGNSTAPVSLDDLYLYLKNVEYSLENLQFLLWHRSYRARFYKLPRHIRALSPSPIPLNAYTGRTKAEEHDDDLSTVCDDDDEDEDDVEPCLQPFRAEVDRVIQTFFLPKSNKELSFDQRVRNSTLDNAAWSTHPDVFAQACHEVYVLIERSSFRNFLTAQSMNMSLQRQILGYIFGVVMLAGSIATTLSLTFLLSRNLSCIQQRMWKLTGVPLASMGAMSMFSSYQGLCCIQVFQRRSPIKEWERDLDNAGLPMAGEFPIPIPQSIQPPPSSLSHMLPPGLACDVQNMTASAPPVSNVLLQPPPPSHPPLSSHSSSRTTIATPASPNSALTRTTHPHPQLAPRFNPSACVGDDTEGDRQLASLKAKVIPGWAEEMANQFDEDHQEKKVDVELVPSAPLLLHTCISPTKSAADATSGADGHVDIEKQEQTLERRPSVVIKNGKRLSLQQFAALEIMEEWRTSRPITPSGIVIPPHPQDHTDPESSPANSSDTPLAASPKTSLSSWRPPKSWRRIPIRRTTDCPSCSAYLMTQKMKAKASDLIDTINGTDAAKSSKAAESTRSRGTLRSIFSLPQRWPKTWSIDDIFPSKTRRIREPRIIASQWRGLMFCSLVGIVTALVFALIVLPIPPRTSHQHVQNNPFHSS
ncbi:hypothetical protein DL93DRAFT_2230834 [Clavulina sp. PMI_390]|nr:hypothetical protein DL93DRAFT_2230834 [Clavulina sp. PMI_390]